ncbi:histidine kinase dimerization/phospho-acceptor domain-containing protein [Alysiella filiformis]|uniref:histidine kinase n=1 Tax=Alysiella filiformis DSM 16848 TaxID=1120981 RepID=A0A286E5I2_9NEIS|nr:histidine kinase dimerization/phospho-acceptor domain-containing protein [Alysiella filiformis]UBQ56646.1 two-component sensor histidine kinase [Alysiella filiformis DSM 16848]SOD66167.1 two-component system, OmpR family, sensor histidine kinase CreC [Alysiella filiformis DSM 16848]
MLKYFKNISLRLFFLLLGLCILLTAWAWWHNSPHIRILIGLNLLILATLAWWLAKSINRIRQYAEAMAANRVAPKPQFGESYLARLVNAIAHLRDELNHRQQIENYVLGLTHELKTPLTAQHAALELLQDSHLSHEQHELIQRLSRNVQKQQQLITQLLELARLENCDALTATQSVSLYDLAFQAAQDAQNACSAKQLHIQIDEMPHTPYVQGNPILLRQAIDNLLYNAVDFADSGSLIHLHFAHTAQTLCLHMDNQGSPIPDYALAKIPQRFYSLPRANGRRSSGLGLSFGGANHAFARWHVQAAQSGKWGACQFDF